MVQISNAYYGGGKFNPFTGEPVVSPQGVFTVSIAGHWYGVDTSGGPYQRDAFSHDSYNAQRQSVNFSNIAGEGTINTDGLWRREQNDWSMGSGQLFLDRQGSMPNRFYKSKGVNPWVKWQLTLLPQTKSATTAPTGTLIKSIAAHDLVYAITSTGIYYTSDYSTWTTVATASGIKDIASNGGYIWTVDGSDTITEYTYGTVGSTVNYKHTGTAFYAVAWELDNLIAAGTYGGHSQLYGVVTQSAAGVLTWSPEVVWTHPDPNFLFTAFATCQGALYVGGKIDGNNGYSNGQVWFCNYDTTTASDLSVPVTAMPLTAGEYVTSMFGYLNYLFIGTNLGVRMCQPTSNSTKNNYLVAGPLIPSINEPVKYPVTGITAHGRFVYFTWNRYDDESTGIGRMDITNFVDSLAPAYASDLMINWSGDDPKMTLDWCPITNGPLMSVPGEKIHTTDTVPVTTGWVDSGRITYGIPDDKIAAFIHFNVSDSLGDVYAYVSANSGGYSPVATMLPPNKSALYQIEPTIRAEYYNVKVVLESAVEGSVLTRWTLQATPALSTETQITQVIQLFDVVDVNGIIYSYDPYAEYLYLDNLRRSSQIVQYLEGPLSADVMIDNLRWQPMERRDNFEGGYRGNLVVTMKTLNGFTYNPRSTA